LEVVLVLFDVVISKTTEKAFICCTLVDD